MDLADSSTPNFRDHNELNKHRAEVLSTAMFAEVMAIDTETNGQDVRDGRGFCIGISIAYRYNGEVKAAYYPVAHTKNNVPDDMRDRLIQIIISRRVRIYHNAKFDIVSLATAGIDVSKLPYYCTMLMTHMMNENLMSKGLDYLSKKLLRKEGKLKGPDWEWAFKIFGWSPHFPSEIMDRYATGDAVDTLELFEGGYPAFKKAGFDGEGSVYVGCSDT